MLPDSLCTLLDKLECEHALSRDEWERLISDRTPYLAEDMKSRACALRDERYGKRVFKRGLIEFTNYCKNDCLYCGIRRSNRCVNRYRLSGEEILQCCEQGYDLGFRTFVLQGGEDPYLFYPRSISGMCNNAFYWRALRGVVSCASRCWSRSISTAPRNCRSPSLRSATSE